MNNTYRDEDFHDLQIESDPGDDTTRQCWPRSRTRTPRSRVRKQMILDYMCSYPGCTAAEIADACGIVIVDSVLSRIAELRRAGYAIHTVIDGRNGKGNPTTYRIEERKCNQ